MKKWCRMAGMILLLSVFCGCIGDQNKENRHELLQAKSNRQPGSKTILLLVADSLMAQAIDEGIKRQALPTFKFMIDHGQYFKDVVSSFPTMSVTIDSTLVTGTYPDEHRVPGLMWYSSDERRVVNYGTGPMEVVRQGMNPVLNDFFINLGGKHLSSRVTTIYEELAKRGRKSGSVNGLIYRGNKNHTLVLPPYVHTPTSLPKEIKVKGPDLLAFGAFSNPLEGVKNLPDGVTRNFGFNNRFALETVKHLIKTGQLPDFLYVYLPDMDRRLHRKGPSDLKGVIKLDGQLRSLLGAFGSPEQALRKATILLVGDSGMSAIAPLGRDPVIRLPSLLPDYRVLPSGGSVDSGAEIILAVNETMAYIYTLNPEISQRGLAETLQSDPRVDLVAWKQEPWIHVIRGGNSGELRFKEKGASLDLYGQSWTLDGNKRILDLRPGQRNRFAFGEFPDALRRLSAAFRSHNGNFLIVTAKQGFELSGGLSPTHRGGGGHGSLHRTESLIPLIICGTDAKPESHRLVDLKKFILRLSASGK